MITDYTQQKHPDFIGDIHGHFDALEILFKKMGYEKKNGIYSHPERFPLFIGDYIDRGPKIMETLQLVRSMEENGSAIALMGNHEFNFLCYHLKDENGSSFRENSAKNEKQLIGTKTALNNKDEFNGYMKWMASLPIAIDSSQFRAVHAQWNNEALSQLKKSAVMAFNQEGLIKIHSNKDYFKAVDLLLKGLEVDLPQDLWYKDYEGHDRKEARVRWWKSKSGNKFGDVFASLPEELMDKDISNFNHGFKDFYNLSEKPVFFGHYWLPPKDFSLTADNACCVDFSIAKKGILGAYRFSGEQKLNPINLVKHN